MNMNSSFIVMNIGMNTPIHEYGDHEDRRHGIKEDADKRGIRWHNVRNTEIWREMSKRKKIKVKGMLKYKLR